MRRRRRPTDRDDLGYTRRCDVLKMCGSPDMATVALNGVQDLRRGDGNQLGMASRIRDALSGTAVMVSGLSLGWAS